MGKLEDLLRLIVSSAISSWQSIFCSNSTQMKGGWEGKIIFFTDSYSIFQFHDISFPDFHRREYKSMKMIKYFGIENWLNAGEK